MRLAPLLVVACSDYEISADVEPDALSVPVAPICDADLPEPASIETDPTCQGEPVLGSFTPVVEWTWTDNPVFPSYHQVMAAPVVGNLTDDDGDGAIDADDVPDVVFTAFTGGSYTSPGVVVALSGADGSLLWTVASGAGDSPYGAGGVAIGDLDTDGEPEVVVGSVNGILVLAADGSPRWSATLAPSFYGWPALADLEGDGLGEVLYGATVVESTGVVRWAGAVVGFAFGSFAVDIDEDGVQEVVNSGTVYRADGSVWWSVAIDGWSAVADLERDGVAEVIVVGGGSVTALEGWTGAVRWSVPFGDVGGGPPTVADLDGDGLPEIGVAGATGYRAFDGDGSLLWVAPTTDASSAITGSSVFDFEGDGAAEIVYADEHTLWVFDGATGVVELAWDSHSSATLFEYPLVVDVDHDGSTEIVVASNDYAFAGSRGITVIGDAANSWAAARPIWNQHAYSVENVDDAGGLPKAPAPSWRLGNSFRAGNSETAVGTALPDLAPGEPDVCVIECADGVVWLSVPVHNAGAASSPGGILQWISVTDGVEAAVGEETFSSIAAGEVLWVGPIPLDVTDFGPGGLVFRVLAADGRDCDLADNERVISTFPCEATGG